MSKKKAFKAESKRLLDLMINSIYTHKEIFLRELISNASDAIDKYYYLSLSDENITADRSALKIQLSVDKEHRTLTISDNGIGMNKDELEDNLGTIAKSGSLAFKRKKRMMRMLISSDNLVSVSILPLWLPVMLLWKAAKLEKKRHTAGKAMLLMVIQSINVKKRSMVQRLL